MTIFLKARVQEKQTKKASQISEKIIELSLTSSEIVFKKKYVLEICVCLTITVLFKSTQGKVMEGRGRSWKVGVTFFFPFKLEEICKKT